MCGLASTRVSLPAVIAGSLRQPLFQPRTVILQSGGAIAGPVRLVFLTCQLIGGTQRSPHQ